MKHIIYGVICGIITILCIFLVVSFEGQTTRRNEVENALTSAVEEALNDTYKNDNYTIQDNKEFIADFTQTLMNNINVGDENNDGKLEGEDKFDDKLKIKVDVLGIDYQKGLLSIRVTETYSALSGKEKEAKYETTAVLDKPRDNDVFTISFVKEDGSTFKEQRITKEDAQTQKIEEVKPEKYQYTYKISKEVQYVYSDEEDITKIPELSKVDSKLIKKQQFKYWQDQEDDSIVLFPLDLTKDKTVMAVYME